MVDPRKLRALLDRLRDTENELRRLRDMGRHSVRDDIDRLNSVKYLFVVAAEVAIDAGQHVIASAGLPVPETFAGVFEELEHHGWVPEGLGQSLAAMARFRNLLVHGYAHVDDDRVMGILHGDGLDGLAQFRSELARQMQDGA